MLGIKKYDIVSIVSANIPEAVISIYALNKIGAVANLLHPLLSENEIKDALIMYKTKYLMAMDINLNKVNKIINETDVQKIIVMSPSDSMKKIKSVLYKIVCYKDIYHGELDSKYIKWRDFISRINCCVYSYTISSR